MAQTFKPEFLIRTIHEVLDYSYNEELMKMIDNDDYKDEKNLRSIIDKCREVYNKEKTVLPFLYKQCGSDQYPFEVIKVYRNENSIPTMIVVREMDFSYDPYGEGSEVNRSDMWGEVKILKKNRKGAWIEVGDYYKSRFVETPLPISYRDPNF